MSCEHVQNQLLERQNGDWVDLREHLDTCESCRALAAAITQEEEAMNQRFETYLNATDFDERWAQVTAATEPASAFDSLRWVQAAAVGLATIGVLTLASQSGPVDFSAAFKPDRDRAEEPAPAPVDDGSIVIQRGRSVLIEFDQNLRAINSADPEVVNILSVGTARRLMVQGTAVGFSAVQVQWGEGEHEIIDFTVVDGDQPLRPSADPRVRNMPDSTFSMRKGAIEVLELNRKPTAISVTDPEVANPASLGVATKLSLTAVGDGITDLLIQYGPGDYEYHHIEVLGQ